MKPVYFTPGPSELFYTVADHMKKGLREQVFSMNHRSPEFREIIRTTTSNLKLLFNLPDSYNIVFCSSATEIWERISLNLISEKAGFIVNGSFSERFAEVAGQWGKRTERIHLPLGTCLDPSNLSFENDIELIGVTHNETSTGACHPMDSIYLLKEKYPNALLAVDIVSSAPVYDMDFSKIDCAYFSVQKGFGLPAGLGVWIFNDKCLEKAKSLEDEGRLTGSYHKLTRLAKQIEQDQTPSTPNMSGIYLLGKVAEDMLSKGLDMIRRESRYKSALLYHALEEHASTDIFVKNVNDRSQTTIVANVANSGDWIKPLTEKGIIIGSGYGEYKTKQIRIANFPTHSKEQFERLVDELAKIN